MGKPRIICRADGRVLVERFRPYRRFEHLLVLTCTVVLVLTGFPQKFYDTSWATWLLEIFGGLDNARTIHRVAGYVFGVHGVLHIGGFLVGFAFKKMDASLVPTVQDLVDAKRNLDFYFGHAPSPPKLPKFDYRQKFDYIGLVLGGLVMVASGLALLFPIEITALLGGQIIPTARVVHSNEAMLALLVLAVWHIYGSHFSPDVFPMGTSIFTGYMEAKHLKEHHRLEYDKVFGEAGSPGPTPEGAGKSDERSEGDRPP